NVGCQVRIIFKSKVELTLEEHGIDTHVPCRTLFPFEVGVNQEGGCSSQRCAGSEGVGDVLVDDGLVRIGRNALVTYFSPASTQLEFGYELGKGEEGFVVQLPRNGNGRINLEPVIR